VEDWYGCKNLYTHLGKWGVSKGEVGGHKKRPSKRGLTSPKKRKRGQLFPFNRDRGEIRGEDAGEKEGKLIGERKESMELRAGKVGTRKGRYQGWGKTEESKHCLHKKHDKT